MKSVLFDLNHPVDVNFFKYTVISLRDLNINVDIIYRDRGKLKDILKYEIPIEPILKGKHYTSFLKKVSGQLLRDLNLYFFLMKRKYEVVVCFGPTSAISSWFSRTPYLAFDDDFEYKIPFYHANLFATKHIYPDFIRYSNKRVIKYHGYKELAYLHPNYFKPHLVEIHKYGILENKYVFIRHISNVSLNYKDTKDTLAELLSLLKPLNLKVLLSIEDKTLVSQFNSEIIVLKEPLSDIYSLMNYALLAISYGDTVARECSLLGVPTVYIGGRNMLMHEELIQEGIMTSTQDLGDIKAIINSDLLEKKAKCKAIVAKKIETQWSDTTMVILDQISPYIR